MSGYENKSVKIYTYKEMGAGMVVHTFNPNLGGTGGTLAHAFNPST